jgi:small-conductance mechanosensitive channel
MVNPITFQNLNFNSTFIENSDFTKNTLITLILLVGVWLIYFVLRLIIGKRCRNIKKRYTWQTRVFYTFLFISIFLFGRIWFGGIQDLMTFLGIIAAALTITQKESLMNLFGCALIYWRELFHTGDRIQIGTFYGEVTSIRTFNFQMLECDPNASGDQTTGKIIKVPNGLVITAPVINFSEMMPFVWHEFAVIVTTDSDFEAVRKFVVEQLDHRVKHYYMESKHYLKKYVRNNFISEQTLKTQSFIKIRTGDPGGIEITVRYLSLPAEQRDLETRLTEALLAHLKATSIAKLAYKN